MFQHSQAFSSFSVDDIDAARAFYAGTLGLDVTDDAMGILRLDLPGGGVAIIYPKPDHAPATFTVLNFGVDDVGATARATRAAGVTMLPVPGFGEPDADGVYRGEGIPDICWFADPAGNVLSIVSEV